MSGTDALAEGQVPMYIKTFHLASCTMTYAHNQNHISYFLTCTSALKRESNT